MSIDGVQDDFPYLKKNSKVLVALSGGVDSAVAAALLQQRGYRVTGITMKIWDGDYLPGRATEKCRPACFGPEEERDVEDARETCRQLGIPFLTVDLREKYRRLILDHSRREYSLGRTPNPCVRCNRLLKFQTILDLAAAEGVDFDFFATGHYVHNEYDGKAGLFHLKKARDKSKDQSYFLYSLTQRQLASCVFPLGDMHKTEVRAIARSLGLRVAEKEESQDFVAGGMPWLLQGQGEPGPIIDEKGRTMGRHKGIEYFTIGQRQQYRSCGQAGSPLRRSPGGLGRPMDRPSRSIAGSSIESAHPLPSPRSRSTGVSTAKRPRAGGIYRSAAGHNSWAERGLLP